MIETKTSDTETLIDAAEVARRLGASSRTVARLADADRMPRPLKVGRLRRWRASEIDRWIAAGCPATPRKAGAK